MTRNQVYLGDCLRLMPGIATASVDMILCDLPYGTTACKWDTVIPFAPLWAQYRRIIKPRGAIVLTASQPFTSALVMSAPDLFRHAWVYKKIAPSNFAQAKCAPMKEHEDVLVFGINSPNYFPIREARSSGGASRAKRKHGAASRNTGSFTNIGGDGKETVVGEDRYPSTVQEFNNRAAGDRGAHPTQKPVALFEYLIKTYTREGDLVLDNCAGSGTTAIACINTKRDYILIEQDETYFQAIGKRIAAHQGDDTP